MKTKNILIGLLATFAIISLNVSAANSDNLNHKKIGPYCNVANELDETRHHFENWMIELKEFNNGTLSFSDEEVQIEDWMTIEFSSKMESEILIDQEITLEDWMTDLSDFSTEEKSADIELAIEPWMYEIM